MDFAEFPAEAAWRHQEARDGFETAWFRQDAGGWRIDGTTTAVEEGRIWAVTYRIVVDRSGRTRRAEVESRSAAGLRQVTLEADAHGAWHVDGRAAPHLDGCLDVDLEASSLTNAFPVRRLDLAQGEQAAAPAAYVRAEDATVERLEQTYLHLHDDLCGPTYGYVAPSFGFTCRLTYDRSGLALAYPGIAVRLK